MVGDRPLTENEIRIFITQRSHELDGLGILRDIWLQKGEPTLHDLAILELLAKFEAWNEFLTEYANRIDALMELYKEQRVRISELETELSLFRDKPKEGETC